MSLFRAEIQWLVSWQPCMIYSKLSAICLTLIILVCKSGIRRYCCKPRSTPLFFCWVTQQGTLWRMSLIFENEAKKGRVHLTSFPVQFMQNDFLCLYKYVAYLTSCLISHIFIQIYKGNYRYLLAVQITNYRTHIASYE